MDHLRQNTMLREIEPIAEIEFPPSETPSESKKEPSSPDISASLQLLLDHRRLLYKVALWALVLSSVVAFLIPNEYESIVRIMPPESSGSAGSMLAALGKVNPELMSLAGNLLGLKSGSSALFMGLFRTRSVQDRVIDRLNLQSVYWKRYKQDARKKLDSRTDITVDRKSDIITLTVSDTNPQRAQEIAQDYVEELNRLLAEVSTSSARRERIFIEQRLVSVKSDLEDAEKQFSAFASKNTALDIKEQTKAMVESSAALQGQLIATESELQSLEQIYTNNNVRVRALQARVDELKNQLQKLQGTDASLISDGAQGDEMYPSIRKLPLLGVQWADLYRRTKIQETVYELLNQQYELARIEEAKEIPTINVIDPANFPEKKSFPPRLLLIIGMSLVSLCCAVASIVLRERWNRVAPEDGRRQLFRRIKDTMAQDLVEWRRFSFRQKQDTGDKSEP